MIRPLGPGAGTAAVITIGLDLGDKEDNVTGGVVGRSSSIVPIYSRKFASTRNVGVLGTKNLWKNYPVLTKLYGKGENMTAWDASDGNVIFAWRGNLGLESILDGSSYF